MLRRFWTVPLLVALASFSLVSLAQAQTMMQAPPPTLPAGTKAPAFTTRTLSGKKLTLKSLRGKVVLLDYWATWCGPCRMSIPAMQSLHKKFSKKGLRVVGLSLDEPSTIAQVKPFAKALHMTYQVGASPRLDYAAAQAYHVSPIPSVFLIDKKGVVRWSMAGYYTGEEKDLTVKIKKLLAEKA